MKLVKLSLVAAMAAGVFATTASAAPLEEVIKDVDVSGYTRLRYTHDDGTDKNGGGESKWNFKGELNIKSKIDDNFFAVVGIRYNEDDLGESESTSTGNHKDSENNDFELHRAYFGYSIYGTTVTVGRQALGTFFTDDMYGDGIKITNTDIEGLTLAALWMDSLENDSDISSNKIKGDDLIRSYNGTNKAGLVAGLNGISDVIKEVTGKRVTDHNLYGVAAIGSYDPVSFQLWYAALEDVVDLFAIELATSFDITDDFNLGLKGQYAFSDFDSDLKDTGLIDDGQFWGIEAGFETFGFDFTAGYVDYSSDDDKTYSLISFEDQGDFISPGEELLDYTLFRGENDYWFVTAAYTIPNTGVTLGVDYLDGENTWYGTDYDMSEVVGRITYKHNKKLTFKTWYSWVENEANGKDWENDRVRFEAKYSF